METKKEGTNSIEIFALKAGIIFIGIFILANFLLPDFDKLTHKFKNKLSHIQDNLKRLETPKSKLILLSFVQNPRALLKVSEIEEAEGKIDNAIRETELAIGLLEMHGADKQIIQKYSDRLNKLMSKKLNMTVTEAKNK